MKKNKLLYILFLVLFCIGINRPAQAAGLRSGFIKIVLEDLEIGHSYNLTKMKNYPLTATNTGEKAIDLKIDPVKPLKSEMRKGYEVIPDVSWIKVGKDKFRLGPGESARTDVVISIPDDEKYSGKSYQAMLWSRGVGGGISAGIKGLILFSIGPKKEALKPTSKPSLGLSVQPGKYLFSKIPVGKRYELPLPLKIENKSDKARTYLLSTYKQSEKPGTKLVKGYSDIPDPKWLFFEKEKVTVEANGVSEVRMYSEIPNQDGYYNQHWVIGIGVEGRPEKGESIVLACYPRYFIETESKYNLTEKPYGLIGIKPGTITLKDVPFSYTGKVAQIEVFNNDRFLHLCEIASAAPTKDLEKGIPLSPSFNWIPDPKWVIHGKKWLYIAGGKSETVMVGLNIPQAKQNYGRRWEALLMVKPDRGEPKFVRVQITTKR